MNIEEYKKAICELVNKINNDKILKQLYKIAHRYFID